MANWIGMSYQGTTDTSEIGKGILHLLPLFLV